MGKQQSGQILNCKSNNNKNVKCIFILNYSVSAVNTNRVIFKFSKCRYCLLKQRIQTGMTLMTFMSCHAILFLNMCLFKSL